MMRYRTVAAIALAWWAPAVVCAQTQAAAGADRAPLGSVITVDALGSLPSSASLYSLIDASIPEVVGDHIDSGGLTTGEAGRLGAHGNTWTQTTFKLDGVDITAPGGSGTPLLLPGVDNWSEVQVATGLLPVDVNSPGLAILLTPRQPSQMWTRTLEVIGSPAGLNAHNENASPPPISRLDTWMHANLSAGGPITPGRLGVFLTATGTNSSRFDRGSLTSAGSSFVSMFGHFVFTPTSNDHVSFILWGQRSSYPFDSRLAWGQPSASTQDVAGHVQVRWDRVTATGAAVSAFASVSDRGRAQDVLASDSVVIERLRDGTAPQVAMPGAGSERRWSFGGQFRPAPMDLGGYRHSPIAGLEVDGASQSLDPMFPVRVGEMVNGIPARVWDFSASAGSSWHSTSLALYASDGIDLSPKVRLDLGLRFEAITGSADLGTTGISWRNLLPRASLRWDMFDTWHIASLFSYGRYGYRLPLEDLAWGDASAPVANVFRWNGSKLSAGGFGPVIQRYGPGTGGDPNFSAVDPNLARPYMDDVTFGFEARPRPSALFRLMAIARKDHNLLGVVDTGATLASAYSTVLIPDPGVDLLNASDDKLVPVYNRLPSSFGADRYLLTNPADDEATFVGVDFMGQVRTGRLFFVMGFTAGRSEAIAASRGFLANENDAGLLGEAFIDPNARTNAQGRVFTERGYTGKIATVYHFAGDITFGVEARYMDGQHFARLLIVPGLTQGAEAVRAFQNGKTRFTYTATLDARLQKDFTSGRTRVTGVIDGYNLLNTATEVEEFPVTGSDPRLTSSVQPPRAIHIGLKVTF